MLPILRAPRSLPLLSMLICGALLAAPKSAPTAPDPKLDPTAVVRIQLEALAHVDEPSRDAGLAIVFGFASPGNRSRTGPLERFTEMIRRGYPEMLNHRKAVLGEVKQVGEQAGVPVSLIDQAGSVHRYIFVLSRQSQPPYAGCWMTDSVVVDPNQPPAEET